MDKNSMIDARTERTNGFWMHGLECSFIGGLYAIPARG